jgi:hypothetical protein
MGIEHDEGLVLAKEYVAAEPGGDVEDFIEFVRSRRRAT